MKIWKEYFEEILNTDTVIVLNAGTEEVVESFERHKEELKDYKVETEKVTGAVKC